MLPAFKPVLNSLIACVNGSITPDSPRPSGIAEPHVPVRAHRDRANRTTWIQPTVNLVTHAGGGPDRPHLPVAKPQVPVRARLNLGRVGPRGVRTRRSVPTRRAPATPIQTANTATDRYDHQQPAAPVLTRRGLRRIALLITPPRQTAQAQKRPPADIPPGFTRTASRLCWRCGVPVWGVSTRLDARSQGWRSCGKRGKWWWERRTRRPPSVDPRPGCIASHGGGGAPHWQRPSASISPNGTELTPSR
jgi:hypothetical protein